MLLYTQIMSSCSKSLLISFKNFYKLLGHKHLIQHNERYTMFNA